ncbi:MAG: Lrp/AsnC ligand binding domain-containing protein [Deltaproteobacteria bacterium]|nr:Lrp/AsnC ligand binding domain-containing protein [Deltaproteobacteria bacterium]MBI3077493.1 Lrp/AsnC ligand binding domain-containing protein [Deltaproteobacteria bacterium]
MPVNAFIFVETHIGKGKEVNEKIREIPGVKLSHAVTGSYDVIAFVEAEDVKVLGEFLVKRIHSIPGVFKTTTNVVVA